MVYFLPIQQVPLDLLHLLQALVHIVTTLGHGNRLHHCQRPEHLEEIRECVLVLNRLSPRGDTCHLHLSAKGSHVAMSNFKGQKCNPTMSSRSKTLLTIPNYHHIILAFKSDH